MTYGSILDWTMFALDRQANEQQHSQAAKGQQRGSKMNTKPGLLGLLCVAMALGGCNSCVTEGTLIATPAGDRKVESLRAGDEVLTISTRGCVEPATVTHIAKHRALAYRTIETADGIVVRLTDQHPVRTISGWTNAGNLHVGQSVQTSSGWQRITHSRQHVGSVTVYDLTVEPNKNFIANGLVLHNKSFPQTVPPDKLPGNWAGFAINNYFTFYYRIELNADGTGLYGTRYGVCDVGLYRITKWSVGDYRWHAPYPFRAELIHVATGTKAELVGTVSWGKLELGFRQPEWTRGCFQRFVVVREEFMDDNIALTKKAMQEFRGQTPVPDSQPESVRN